MRTEILRLHRRISATIIYVTHDQVEAMTMSTRLAVMDAGAAIQIDPPRVIFDAPENKTVATFIGTPAMNIVPADIVQDGEGLALDLLGRRLAMPDGCAQAIGARRKVEIGVRPQALRLAAPDGAAIRGAVLLREPLGLEDEFLVQIGAATVKVVTSQGRRFAEGSAVGLELDPVQLYLFDPETGRMLCCGLAGNRVDDAA
jgi:multiple sugar transport system ATP-binding protein